MTKQENYIPSNGTEGMMFTEAFCEQCIHERWMHFQNEDREEDKCEIFSNSLLYHHPVYDKDLPLKEHSEWVSDELGARCLQFQKWDWGNDRDGFNEPPEPPPYDPNQLVLFSFDEEIDELLKVELLVAEEE